MIYCILLGFVSVDKFKSPEWLYSNTGNGDSKHSIDNE